MSRRAAIITGQGFQDHDVIYTYYRLIEEGWEVSVATKDGRETIGKYGVPFPWTRPPNP